MIRNPMANRGVSKVRLRAILCGVSRFYSKVTAFEAVSGCDDGTRLRSAYSLLIYITGCFAFLLLWQISAPAQQQPLPVVQGKLQNLKVTVLDSANNKPISGATVAVPFWSIVVDGNRTNTPSAKTDDQGVADLWVMPVPNNFSIAVEHPKYAAREGRWYDNRPATRGVVPAAYTFHLSPGIGIGGHVRDEKGKPLAGVALLVWGDGYVYPNNSGNTMNQQEFSSMQRNEQNTVFTDQNGFWLRNGFPPDLEKVRIEAVRPGGARGVFQTADMRRWGGDMGTEVDSSDLKATNAVLVMREGITVRGLVADEAGKPIAGALIRERVGRQYYGRLYEITNDASGRFELSHRGSAQLALTATAPGFATKSVAVTPVEGLPEVRMTMPREKPLRVRVLGDKGEPVPNLSFRIDDYRSGAQVLQWTANTDAEGRVVWTNAPDQAVAFYLSPTNYPPRQVTLLADGSEKVVRLSSNPGGKVGIHVRAVDAQTEKPVAKFEIWRDVQWNRWPQPWVTNGGNGEFRGELSPNDFRDRGTVYAYQLQVRAEGYAPFATEYLNFSDGDQDFTARLTNSPPPAGIVYQPDGRPAAGAKVILNTREQSMFLGRPGDFYNYSGVLNETTGTNGAFRFSTAEDINPILVQHPTGFASLRVAELRKTGKVQLQAWARVEGASQFATNGTDRITIKFPLNWNSVEAPFRLMYTANFDATGKFLFTNLPPGDYVLFRQPFPIMNSATVESHRWPLSLAAGETKKVDYRFGGRTVVGHLDANAEVNWQSDGQMLVQKRPEPPPAPGYNDFIEPKDYEKARDAYARLPAVIEHESKRQQFQLVFDRDGDFKADDVLPGDYEMQIRITKPPEDRYGYRGNQPLIGSLTKKVTVPPGPAGTEVDLGAFEIEVKGPKMATSQPIGFRGSTIDGKEFDIISLRGEPVVLIFWAQWAPLSTSRLADVRALRTETNARGKVKIVAVNLDDDLKIALDFSRDLKDGIHIRAEGRARVDLTEQLGIDVLPSTLLLDAQGRIVGRDASGKRLRSALDRLLAQMAKK